MLLLQKTFQSNKMKFRLNAGPYACALCLCLLLRACSAAAGQLVNALHAPPSPGAIATSALPHAAIAPIPGGAAAVPASTAASYQSAGARTVLRIYDECSRADGGFVPCLKKKTISFIDRISHIDTIAVADGVKLVRLPSADIAAAASAAAAAAPLYSENELEASPSRSSEDRDTKLTNLLIERLSQFFNGHSLQVNFPKLTSEEIGRGLEEGRGKMKKMMSMMMMGMAMKMMGMIPVAMGMLYMLAGKALIISKIALLLAGIMGLKKLMSGRGGSGGGSSGWSSGGGGGGGWSSGGGGSGGYDRRSLDVAHELAYRGYTNRPAAFIQQQQQQVQQQQKPLPLHQLQPQVQKS